MRTVKEDSSCNHLQMDYLDILTLGRVQYFHLEVKYCHTYFLDRCHLGSKLIISQT